MLADETPLHLDGYSQFVVGFSTNKQYYALVDNCIQSKMVNSMFVFNTKEAQDKRKIGSEMKRFMEVIKQITSTSIFLVLNAEASYIHQVEKPINIAMSESKLIVEDGFFVTKFDNEPRTN